MKKRRNSIILLVVLAIYWGTYIYYYNRSASFNDMMNHSLDWDKVKLIRIVESTPETKSRDELEITDGNQVQEIIGAFSSADIKRERNSKTPKSDHVYEIHFLTGNKDITATIVLFANNYVDVHVSDLLKQKKNGTYTITSGFDYKTVTRWFQ